MENYIERAKKIAKKMALVDKASLLSGADFWNTKTASGVIPAVRFADGPHGLRIQTGKTDHLGINESLPATCFPAAGTTACSFDPQLVEEIGVALGEECKENGVDVLLGPAINLKRNPLGGRNFEYVSEDPYLSGQMGKALIKGIQSTGTGACVKHYAVNSQETGRMMMDMVVDERALRELYLSCFEIPIREAKPLAVMCAYNRVNGEFCSENKWLLSDILRDEWGYQGTVITDWGAIVHRVKGVEAGVDLEMPYSGPQNDADIVAAVQSGKLSEEVVTKSAERIIALALQLADARNGSTHCDRQEHHALAKRAAAESAVLLKNDGSILPLQNTEGLVVIGAFGKTPRYQGSGSSRVNAWQTDSLCDALSQQKISYQYFAGYKANGVEMSEDFEIAIEAAKKAKIVIAVVGLPDSYETEGIDRKNLKLPQIQNKLVEKLLDVNLHTVVLLQCGGPVEMPWIQKCRCLLFLSLGGQAGGDAAVDLLLGKCTPSGKLAESFPFHLDDVPSAAYFPGEHKRTEYRESLLVGYRYYDKAQLPPMFPFGYGLSYTTFRYTDFTTSKHSDHVSVSLKVKNIGEYNGAEIIQIYVGKPYSSVLRPVRELKAFQKVFLVAGEEKKVQLSLPISAFSFYDVDTHAWRVEDGCYVVEAANSSRDIRCVNSIELQGETLATKEVPKCYQNPPIPFSASLDDFSVIAGKAIRPEKTHDLSAPLTIDSTIPELLQNICGPTILQKLMGQAVAVLENFEDDKTQAMFAEMQKFTPIRVLCSFGGMSLKELEEELEKANQLQKRGGLS